MTYDWCRDKLASASCTAEGCRHCCIGKREHSQFWCRDVGFHGYTEPTREQIRQRMWARRLTRIHERTMRDPVWQKDDSEP